MNLNLNLKNPYARAILLTLLCVPVILISLYKHELWGDEFQAWALAREAGSLSDLYYSLRYEGNPGLWHVLLFVFSRFTDNYYFLKYLNFIFIVTGIFILNLLSPFKLWQKLLIIFGYFFVYEYGGISRHYALTLMLTFVGLASYKFKDSNPLIFILLAAPVSYTSPYGTQIYLTLILTALFSWVIKKDRNNLSLKVASILLGLCLVMLSFLLSVPPEDGSYTLYRTYRDEKLAKETIAYFWQSYIPLPENKINAWNSNVIKILDVRFYLSLALFTFFNLFFRKHKPALFFYIVGSGFILLFSYIKFSGALRHYGHLYLILLSALWIYCDEQKPDTEFKFFKIVPNIILAGIFISQIVAGGYFLVRDYKEPFYYTEEAANYIKSSGKDSYYLLGDNDVTTIDVANALKKPMFLSKVKKERYFIKYDANRTKDSGNEDRLFQSVSELRRDGEEKLLLILSYPVDKNTQNVILLKNYGPSIALRRNLYIYEYVEP